MKRYNPIRILGGAISRTKRIIIYWQRKRSFGEYHYSDYIEKPIRLTPKYIWMGENVSVFCHARIEGVYRYNNMEYTPKIVIEEGVSIQQNLHLTCAKSILIGKSTAIAANVTITDVHHPYTDINIPIEKQDIQVASVIIGEDCKLYNNVVILPGTQIGKHVTIGANSVVSGEIPDYSVAVGCPARVVKRYDFTKEEWVRQ